MTNSLQTGKVRHILLWCIAILYLLTSPLLYYRFFPLDGKPIERRQQQPEKAGAIRYNVESCKFWAGTGLSHVEGDTYALLGWAFIREPKLHQADFDRFAVIYDSQNAYVFPMKIFRRPDVQETFKDLGLTDLASSGFYAVIAKNALAAGEYGIGLWFKHKQDGTSYYIQTDKILVRSPNHLLLEPKSK